jgi:hypothetical protein
VGEKGILDIQPVEEERTEGGRREGEEGGEPEGESLGAEREDVAWHRGRREGTGALRIGRSKSVSSNSSSMSFVGGRSGLRFRDFGLFLPFDSFVAYVVVVVVVVVVTATLTSPKIFGRPASVDSSPSFPPSFFSFPPSGLFSGGLGKK